MNHDNPSETGSFEVNLGTEARSSLFAIYRAGDMVSGVPTIEITLDERIIFKGEDVTGPDAAHIVLSELLGCIADQRRAFNL